MGLKGLWAPWVYRGSVEEEIRRMKKILKGSRLTSGRWATQQWMTPPYPLDNPPDHPVSAPLCFGYAWNVSTAPWVESGDKAFTEASLFAEWESGFSVTLEWWLHRPSGAGTSKQNPEGGHSKALTFFWGTIQRTPVRFHRWEILISRTKGWRGMGRGSSPDFGITRLRLRDCTSGCFSSLPTLTAHVASHTASGLYTAATGRAVPVPHL